MQYRTSLVAAATLSSFALAAPTSPGKQVGSVESFSVNQTVAPFSGYKKNGARAYLKSLRRYGAHIPTHVKHAAAKAAAAPTGAVTTTPEANDQEYLSPVQIGTPAQTLNLDFDTGSADLWVFSSELSSSETSGHSIYTPGSSSTSQEESGDTWTIQYGDGSGAAGNVFADKVVIGGVTATSQAVEAATSISTEFTQDTANDGLVGLAFSSINTVSPDRATTFFDTVKASLAAPLFAANLRHNAPGTYDFGATDSSKFTGTIGYTDVETANGFWEFTAGAFSVGGAAAGDFGDSIADTGTSIILATDDVIDAYYTEVDGAEESEEFGGVVFPCSATLPDLSITIAGAARTVPGSYINYAVAEGNTCYGGIQSNSGLPFSILGDTFLKSQYVVFNGGATPQIGFAAQS